MPTSKQARARQARQKQRVAELHVTREQKKRRNRRIGAGLIALLLIVGVILAIAAAIIPGDTKRDTGASATTPSTSAALKRCVGLKDPLPKGAPTVAIPAGAAAPKLETKDVKVGTGAVVPKNAPKVTVNYVGIACTTGKIFDSSYSRNKPFTANLDPNATSRVIAGWQQGIPGMKVGGVRLLQIPADLAYGAAGQPPAIGPSEPLFFIVSVVSV